MKLTWRNLSDIELVISIPIVSSPPIQPANHTHDVQPHIAQHSTVEKSIQEIELGPLNISLPLAVVSILLEEVIDVCLEVDVVSEVAWSRRSHVELLLVRNRVGALQLLVGSVVVLFQESE